jgi:hypothetical protein
LEDYDIGILNSSTENEILEAGSCLRGRYLWSVLYAEELIIANISVLPTTIQAEVEKAASRARERAKAALKQRLAYLTEIRDHQSLLQSLCSIAIRSDVLKQRTIFTGHQNYKLITQGFAQVKMMEVNGRSIPIPELTEQLAIDATIEWFRKEQFETYRNAMVDFLVHNAMSGANLGNAAEYSLPLVRSPALSLSDLLIARQELWKCLTEPQSQSEVPLGSSWAARRFRLLERLNQARLLDRTSNRLTWSDLYEYPALPESVSLLQGSTMCSGYVKFDLLMRY